MKTATTLAAALAALLLAAGCAGTSPSPAPAGAALAPATEIADQSCLRDVAATTGNRDVRVVSTTTFPTRTEVIVGVGPTGQWRCTAYPDGTTAGIMSITDEGAL